MVLIFVGCHRSLRDYFIEERDKCVNFNVTETNKLIMRLDKLMSDCPPDIERKSQFLLTQVVYVSF